MPNSGFWRLSQLEKQLPGAIKRSRLGKKRQATTHSGHAVRETHHTQSPYHQATLVPSGTTKTITDAWNGCHSVPIREEDRHLTNFITPWGRYRYKTCPQGYASSQDGYTRKFDEMVNDFPNRTKCIKDTCLWADTLEESFFQTCRWLDVGGRLGIVQNPKNIVFGSDAVEVAGFVITPTVISLAPFRELLKPSSTFYWDDQLQQVFEQSKAAILNKITEGV